MKYVKVLLTNELTAGNKMKVLLGTTQILLTNIDNTYYAINNTCPHMGGSLYKGELEGKEIIFPRHGTIFDVTTGKVTQNGNILFFKLKVDNVQCYPVKIEGTDILIGIE